MAATTRRLIFSEYFLLALASPVLAQSSSTARTTAFVYIGIVAGLIVLCVIFGIFVCFLRKHLQHKKQRKLRSQAQQLAHNGIFEGTADGTVVRTTNGAQPGLTVPYSYRTSPNNNSFHAPLLSSQPPGYEPNKMNAAPVEMPGTRWAPIELSAEESDYSANVPHRQQMPGSPGARERIEMDILGRNTPRYDRLGQEDVESQPVVRSTTNPSRANQSPSDGFPSASLPRSSYSTKT